MLDIHRHHHKGKSFSSALNHWQQHRTMFLILPIWTKSHHRHKPLANHWSSTCPYAFFAGESLLCVLEAPLCTPIHPISEEKSTKGALISITRSLKNPNNCNSNCSDKKLPDTPLKTFSLKQPIYTLSSIPSCFLHIPSFLSLLCIYSNTATSHSSPGPQQKSVMYRDTELLTWPSLKLQMEHYPACPAPEYVCAQRKKIPSHPQDTELYQVRTQSEPDFNMKVMFNWL